MLTFVVVFLLTRVVIVRIERSGQTDWNRNMRMTGKSRNRYTKFILLISMH